MSNEMPRRQLGRSGVSVSAIGLGCMGMSDFYGAADEAKSIETMHRAIDLGVDFFDTADIYGPFTNEELVGRAHPRPPRTASCSRPSSATCGRPTGSFSGSTAVPSTCGRRATRRSSGSA